MLLVCIDTLQADPGLGCVPATARLTGLVPGAVLQDQWQLFDVVSFLARPK